MLDRLVNVAIMGAAILAVPPDVVHHHRSVVAREWHRLVRWVRRQAEPANYDVDAHRARMIELQREFDELG